MAVQIGHSQTICRQHALKWALSVPPNVTDGCTKMVNRCETCVLIRSKKRGPKFPPKYKRRRPAFFHYDKWDRDIFG